MFNPLQALPYTRPSEFIIQTFIRIFAKGLGWLNISRGPLPCQGHFLQPPRGVILSYAPQPRKCQRQKLYFSVI